MPVPPAVRLYFLARGARFRYAQVRPLDAPTVLVEGARPVRVLIAGAGLAAGYGVESWMDSMAGALARGLALGMSRGVRVDVRAAPMLPARNAVEKLGPNGAYSYDAVVFAPCYLEASISPGAGVGRHAEAIQQHLLDTGGAQLRHVLMLGIPRPSKYSRLNLAAAEAANITNRVLRGRSADVARVTYLEPPPFTSLEDAVPFDRRYYAELGTQVAAKLTPRLHAPGHTHERSAASNVGRPEPQPDTVILSRPLQVRVPRTSAV